MTPQEELAALRRLAELEAKAGVDASSQAPMGAPMPPSGENPSVVPAPQQEGMGEPNYSGAILPFSNDPQGRTRFDTNAGLLGVIKRALMLPEDVYKGRVDPSSSEGLGRALEAATVFSPMGAASRVGGVLAPRTAYRSIEKAPPTREALEEATKAGYQQARDLGAEFAPAPFSQWADDAISQLNARGQIAENYPKVHKLLEKIKNPPEGAESISLEGVEALRKELGRLGGDIQEGATASFVQKGLDEYTHAIDPSHLVAGTASPAEAARLLRESRGNAAAGFRSDRITGLEESSARRAAAANSGRNADNTIRQRLASLLENRKASRGLNEEEKSAIEDIIYGRPTKNAARYFGNIFGGGGGLGQTMLAALGSGTGFAAGGGPGAVVGAAIPGVIGTTARSLANRMTKNELRALDDLIRKRSPLYESMPTPMPDYVPHSLSELMTRGAGATFLPNNSATQDQIDRFMRMKR